jgi:hypothetical protein
MNLGVAERMKEVYYSFIQNIGKMNRAYEQYVEDFQRINQQWLNYFWRPS